jgi:hypothetical protein
MCRLIDQSLVWARRLLDQSRPAALCGNGQKAGVWSSRDGSPRGASTTGGTPSVPQDIAQEDGDGDGHGGTTAHVSRRPRPRGKAAAVAARQRSRRRGDAGASVDEIALTDALAASTKQIAEHLTRSEVQRTQSNETSLRRVLVLEHELEVRKFELPT